MYDEVKYHSTTMHWGTWADSGMGTLTTSQWRPLLTAIQWGTTLEHDG